MPECPVCRTTYVKDRAASCHVCGWQLDTSGFSQIGPVKIEHQLSQRAMSKIEAWAHHMWATIQQQKNRIAELQTQLRQANRQPLPKVTLPTTPHNSYEPATSAPPTPHADAPSPSPDLWQWVLQRLDQADRERSQLQFQVSQLRAKLQQQAQVQPTLTGIAPDEAVPLLTGSDGTRWQAAIAQLQADTQAEIAKTQTDAIAPLNQTVQAQQQELQHLQETLITLQGQLQGYDQAIQDYQEQAIALPEQLAALHTLVQTRLEHLKTQLTQQVLSEALATQQQEVLGDVERQMTQAQTYNQQQVGQLRDRLDRLQSQWQQNLQRLQTQSEIHHNQWQTQKIEVATQLAQFDTMAERFQQMEAQITQLQQAIARLGRPSATPMRHTNTVYTRYQ